jgi:hypothetical protein
MDYEAMSLHCFGARSITLLCLMYSALVERGGFKLALRAIGLGSRIRADCIDTLF